MTSVGVERRSRPRGRLGIVWDILYRILRWIFQRVHSLGAALGVVLLAAVAVAGAATYAFVKIAAQVRGGRTQAFDEAVLRWLALHHHPFLDEIMVELTVLGTWIVVLTVVGVAGLFLFLTRHKFSALLLLVATAGGILLNTILKLGFQRPRPSVFEWKTEVASSSFPSGHATSAVVVYGTVAYLAARLHKTSWARVLTLFGASLYIFVICVSRLYLGVHYPSDVLAGAVIGLAWASLCMATLEAIQRIGKRTARHREVLEYEEPAPKDTPAGRSR
jgi:undecaprenyl-diphosphatase